VTAQVVAAATLLLCAACAVGPARPVAIDTLNDQCASCRMVISDPRFAAQIAAPGEEPRFFDDLHCLRDILKSGRPLPAGAVVFVVDHRTGAWVPAADAVFARVPAIETPMASHWVAYADAGSRDADPYAAGGAPVAAAEVLGMEPLAGGAARPAAAGGERR
jgi:copper chaperone NosL